MASPEDQVDRATAPREPRAQSMSTRYFLILYNFISAILWAAILGRVVLVAALYSSLRVHFITNSLLQWTQSLAILEIVFSLTGIVRAPLLTTLMQVASRLLLVWGIIYNFTSETAGTPEYVSMLIAWSTTEVVRYSFFAISLTPGLEVPRQLLWARYNFFFVLYPLGIYSECKLIYNSIPAAGFVHPALPYVLWGILGIYIPGSYILYTHMMAQRRKVIKGKFVAKTQ